IYKYFCILHCNFDICILIFTLKFFLLSLSPKEEPIYEKAIRFAFLLARSEAKASHYKSFYYSCSFVAISMNGYLQLENATLLCFCGNNFISLIEYHLTSNFVNNFFLCVCAVNGYPFSIIYTFRRLKCYREC
ncbi:MAG: hypothetical protein AB1422_12720, partial [bacterium]